MTFSFPLFIVGVVFVLLQVVAAIPWLVALNWDILRRARTGAARDRAAFSRQIGTFLLSALGAMIVVPAILASGLVQDREGLLLLGRLFTSLLHLQLIADAMIITFALVLLLWPKGGAVALAAFREGVRQPMFWLLAGFALLLMITSPFIPYFTFGEDYVVVQELGFDTIMLVSVLLGVLSASMSISEEIEGRTAITLMSKPVSRRQFLLGKFLGIFLVTVLLTGLLGWFFQWVLLAKHWYDRMDPVVPPGPLLSLLEYLNLKTEMGEQSTIFIYGAGLWVADALATLPGLMLGSCQVMVLLAIAVALATRLPMIPNIVICWVIYTFGHLTPVIAQIAERKQRADPGAAAGKLLAFTSQVFDIALPGLEFFNLAPALAMDAPLPHWPFFRYIGSVVLYGLVYTIIALLFGLVLFEDRDLA
jgi:ABC-type transport system involved in multi-copper enzyme maturation permease subunit